MADNKTTPLLAEGKEKKQRISTYLIDPTKASKNGLSTVEATKAFEKFGPNELAEKERNKCWEFFKHFWGPMPIMIWLAIIVETIQAMAGDPEKWADAGVLLTLQTVNGLLGWYEESKAGDAIAALKNSLAPSCEVKRDGKWQKMEARMLVPGDVVKLALGGNVPADCMVMEGKPVQIDQSAMTGESLPVTMRKGDTAKMGSNVVAGEADAVVVATGAETFFGKTAAMINSVEEEGHFQKIIWNITLFLLFVSFVLVGFIMAIMLLNGNTFLDTLGICVVLLVASIPIAMQVVCTSTMALGSHALAKQGAIVSRLAAIEEIAGMDMLCSDKTGTLTTNKMTMEDKIPYPGYDAKQLVLYAMLGTAWTETAKDAIDTMLFKVRGEVENDLKNYESIDYEPFDPSIKRTAGTVKEKGASYQFKVTKGAPNVIASLAHNKTETETAVAKHVDEYAARGIRCLGIAATKPGYDDVWHFCGILTFIDPPRSDTRDVIHRAMELGVGVKMITGDHVAIAKDMCKRLDLGTTVLSAAEIAAVGNDRLGDLAEGCDGFAGVYPEHKFDIVESLRKRGWCTGMTGDGVNDAPALKRADIGIAVEGATDAARAAADIVLTKPGLSVIVDAIDLARRIFQRMKNYITYRIACTLQLLVFFFLSVLFIDPNEYFKPEAGIGDGQTKGCTNLPAHDDNGKELFYDQDCFPISRYFALPVMAMVLITILNDGTIISIAYDHVVPGHMPEKWNLPVIITVACILGFIACASSIMMLLLCLTSTQKDNMLKDMFHEKALTYKQIMCVIYLKVSISDFLTVFSARTQGFFFERKPGTQLFCAACFATFISTMLARFWPWRQTMEPITWRWCGIVWIYCIAWWWIQDIFKFFAFKGLMKQSLLSEDTKMQKMKLRQSIKASLGKEDLGASLGSNPSSSAVMDRIAKMEAELAELKKAVQNMK